MSGLIPSRDKDVVGLGMYHVRTSDEYRDEINPQMLRETGYELYYSIQVTGWLTLTPDLQYIARPGGLTTTDDAFVIGLRARGDLLNRHGRSSGQQALIVPSRSRPRSQGGFKEMAEVATEPRKYSPPEDMVKRAHINSMEQYREMYKRSIDDPDGFWAEVANQFHWEKKWTKVREYDFKNDISIKWFMGAKTNITYNCLDRHLADRGDQVAIIWEGNEPGEDAKLTYKQLHEQVCKFANVLKSQGVKKGDRVSIYMPMVKELAIAMLACARIGAIHSIVFGGFSADSLADRIVDSACEVLVTTDGVYRGAKAVALKANADQAMELAAKQGVNTRCCVVCERVGRDKLPIEMKDGRDVWWEDVIEKASPDCPPEWMDSEDPLFVLYTSGSTGKPKGVLHTIGGYMVFTAYSHKVIFDYHDGDIYWCTADIGWVTGHSYIVYGPLANGATTIMFEGVPTYPDAGRFWDVVDKYKVNQFYTAPTAIRAIMQKGDEPVNKRKLTSLRLLGTVGEPINPEAWNWYNNVVGKGRCPIVDTWWQTETGGILITPLPGAIPTKPGSATLPFFGVKPLPAHAGRQADRRSRFGCAVHRRALAGHHAPRSTGNMPGSKRRTSRPIRACTSPAMVVVATRTATTGSPAGWTT